MEAKQAYLDKYYELGAVIRGLDEDLTRAIVAPDDVNWVHVGDLAWATYLALELRDFLRGDVK